MFDRQSDAVKAVGYEVKNITVHEHPVGQPSLEQLGYVGRITVCFYDAPSKIRSAVLGSEVIT